MISQQLFSEDFQEICIFFLEHYHFPFKNIALVGSIFKFDQTVFVYLCIYICLFFPLTLLFDQFGQKKTVRFLQLFRSGVLNGLKSVKALSNDFADLNFLTKQLCPNVYCIYGRNFLPSLFMFIRQKGL